MMNRYRTRNRIEVVAELTAIAYLLLLFNHRISMTVMSCIVKRVLSFNTLVIQNYRRSPIATINRK
jgi:hypothetical protein